MGAEIIKFEIKHFEGARVIGRSVIQKFDADESDPTIPDLWNKMFSNGDMDFLFSLDNRITQQHDRVGWEGDINHEIGGYTYFAGVLTKQNKPVPVGYEYRDIPKCQVAYAQLQDNDINDGTSIHGSASGVVSAERDKQGYEFDGSMCKFEMEYYSFDRFDAKLKHGEKVVLDFYTPCKKVSD